MQLANELQLVRALNEELLEDERRSEPLEPTATDHASLAIRHSCEALARGWLNGQQLLWALCFASCDGSARGPSTPLRPGSTSARSGSPGSFLSRSPAHPPSPTNRLLEEQLAPSSGASVLGEEGVIEVHLPRKLKRSNTQRLSTIDQAEKANAEAQAHEHAKLFMVPEDKPEVVAIAGFWCAAHASKQAWDLSMLTLILYSCVIIPFRIGMAAPAEGFGKTVEHFVTILFIIDLSLNFNTAYPEGTHYVIHRGMIARNYVSGWFWIDLASSFPFEEFSDWLEHLLGTPGSDEGAAHSASLKLLRALRLFRLMRLLKLLKLQQYIDTIEDKLDLNLQFLQIVKMVLGLLYLMHILGCGWFFVATNSGYKDTWLSNYDGGSGIDAPIDIQYLYSIYWALMTLTTVGYGDITPANNPERAYALFSLLIGALVFGFMLSSIGDLIGSLDKAGARLQEKLDEVKEFTRWHKMPPDLAARVRKYYEFYYSRQSALPEDEILANFAPSLKHDVMSHLLSRTVGLVSFFYVPQLGSAEADPPPDVAFQNAVYPLLKPVVREAKEVIIPKGCRVNDLFFLHRGSVHAQADWTPWRPEAQSSPEPHRLFTLSDQGAFFSEAALTEGVAEVSYVAAVRTEFFCLSRDELLGLFAQFEHARPEIGAYVKDDLLEHKKMRYFSLRFAVREAHTRIFSPEEFAGEPVPLHAQRYTRAGKSGGAKGRKVSKELESALSADEVRAERVAAAGANIVTAGGHSQLEQWAALRLQVGWLRSNISKVAATSAVDLLPLVFGAPQRTLATSGPMRRVKTSAKIAVEAFPDTKVGVGVLPFGGALVPSIRSPRATAAAAAAEAAPKGGLRPIADGGDGRGNPSALEGDPVRDLSEGYGAVERKLADGEARLNGLTREIANIVTLVTSQSEKAKAWG